MKKASFVALCLCAGMAASAQNSLVKDAQKSFKAGSNYVEWIKTLEPAFSNAESKDQAFTYFVPAKAGYENFDYLFTLLRAGQDVDVPNMGNSILSGYEYALKALPLDSVADKKGKIKTKHSKDLIKMVASHYNDYDYAARYLYNSKKWAEAYKAWEIYFAVPEDARFAKDVTVSPDSILAENAYLMGYVASQMEDWAASMKSFDKAIALGSKDKGMFHQAMYVAKMNQDMDKLYDYAQKGYAALGTSDPIFFQLTIEGKLRKKQYDEAMSLLTKALAEEPQNPVYNIAMGSLYEEQGNKDKALECYRKAAQYDPKNGDAFYNIGRVLAEQSDAISESAGSKITEAEYKKIESEQINPLRKEAAENFEKAYQLNENPNALQYLKNIYYVLGDNANFERVNSML